MTPREHRRSRPIFPVCLVLLGCCAVAAAEPAARAQTFRIGSYSAWSLEDGALQEPNDGKSFVVDRPPAEVAQVLTSGGAPGDHFEFQIHPLLVKTADRVLLFDTGAGSAFGPIAGRLPESLRAAGVEAGAITDIFISHAHGDHIGGLVTPAGVLAYPKATIHISAPEWQWLQHMTPDVAEQVGIANLTALVSKIKPRVIAFEPGANLIAGIVKAVPLKGHTPGHSGYEIGSGAEAVLYIGDAMHSYVVSVRKPDWKVAFDNDQVSGAATRVALDESLSAKGERVFAVHFPFPGLGTIVHGKDGYSWAPQVGK